VRPHEPVREAIAVADGVAEREAGRLVQRAELAAEVEEACVIIGWCGVARLVDG